MYEIKRPKKDKKLPIVLSQEEVSRIISSVSNIKHKSIIFKNVSPREMAFPRTKRWYAYYNKNSAKDI